MTEKMSIEEARRQVPHLDCREMEPTVIHPDCSFLRCQIGNYGTNLDGDTIFRLMAHGTTWERALEMMNERTKAIAI